MLVGAPQITPDSQGPGAAFVFTRSAGEWLPQQKLEAMPKEEGASFGWSVALQGELAAVGGPHPGSPHAADNAPVDVPGKAFVFQRAQGQWTQSAVLQATTPRESDYFGISVRLSGAALLVGASGDTSRVGGIDVDPNRGNLHHAGAFYLFAQDGPGWRRATYLKASNPERGALFGEASAVWGDDFAVTAVQGSGAVTLSGAVYVFR